MNVLPPLQNLGSRIRDHVPRLSYPASRIPHSGSRISYLAAHIVFFCLLAVPCFPHELRPAYLELHQTASDTYDVLWKVPAAGKDRRLALYVRFPENCVNVTPPRATFSGGAYLERWRVKTPKGLSGERITIDGLSSTMTDVLVRMERIDGTMQVTRLTPDSPSFTVEATPDNWEVAWTYSALGIEHILTGADHLLFVFALMLITLGPGNGIRDSGYGISDMRLESRISHRASGLLHRASRIAHPASRITDLGSRLSNLIPLIKTITAFTIAHSITLTAATLGFVQVPQRPVEAVIALSIVFVATEIVRKGLRHEIRDSGLGIRDTRTEMRNVGNGIWDMNRESRISHLVSRIANHVSRITHPDSRIQTLTARAPWVVALTFGLLHGFGFAGALSEAGLPQAHIPLALLCFNVGVELGQLLFIAAVLSLLWVVREMLNKMRDGGLGIWDTRTEMRDVGKGIWDMEHESRIADRASGLGPRASRIPHLALRITLAPAYAIGTVAMFWVIQRIAAF